MVKKYIALTLSGIFVLGAILVGCNQASSPLIPANGAVLELSIPKILANAQLRASVKATAKGVHASASVPDSSQGRLKYCLSAPGEIPIKGTINYASGSDVGTVTITLPKAGKWVVAAEWFYTYVYGVGTVPVSKVKTSLVPGDIVEVPEFAGADVVDVKGTTTHTVNMEDFWSEGLSCYYTGYYYPGYLQDSGYAACASTGAYSYYSFDQGYIGFSGDVQAEFDSASGSTYLADGGSGQVSFAYLGTGDLVNFASIPDNATYYPTTLAAKAAVLGQANETLSALDVYVVKGVYTASQNNNGKAWIQIDQNGPYYCPGTNPEQGGEFNFWFIYNSENLNYMKFDETTDGHYNCNQNFIPS